MGEKFAATAISGTGSLTVPIPTSPGRSGFGPELAFSYDSGSGNGVFGLGWRLSMPSVTRKTDNGLPRYQDTAESDVFVLSAEDLVPILDGAGNPVMDTTSVAGYSIQRFRRRIESDFTRIERWSRQTDGDVHWRTLSPHNVLAVYGRDSNSRIQDPKEPSRIYSWLLSETRDDRGNAILVEYKPEDATGVVVTRPDELGRGDVASVVRTANRYPKHIRYGNVVPLLDGAGQRPVDLEPAALDAAGWMFEVVFDYGEHSPNDPRPLDPWPWLCRNDPFSVYRPGFEVRTYRLCQRVLMFHHFPNEINVGQDCLVRSVDLAYRDDRGIRSDRQLGNPIVSFVDSLTQRGYIRAGVGYTSESLPPLAFQYSQAQIGSQVQQLDTSSLENLPIGFDDLLYRWVDLNGEGLAGVLTEQAGGWFYKPNLGNGRLGALEPVAPRPSLADLRDGRQQLLDLEGDGRLDLVQLEKQPAGFFARTLEEGWENFVPFMSRPNLDWHNPTLRLIDLTGDGLPDLLITDDDTLTWYPSQAKTGFSSAQSLPLSFDEERGPRMIVADATQSIFLADMSGDGLTDLVRIRNGQVCYWPNCGYGHFGARVVMRDSPWFDLPDKFEPGRLRMADVDGGGVVDILYVGAGEVRIWLNQSGNGWSQPEILPDLPHLDERCVVQVADLLGNGTACLVWSSPLPIDARSPVRYIDLMGGVKPHLLIGVMNNLGAETRVKYAASTRFYLEDRQAGRPWITRLPFPVHVVERAEHIDHVSGTRLASNYAYHHGYFDSAEREFRGFAMVEQQDTEAFEDYKTGVMHIDGTQELAPELYQPPVTVRTWFHTGAYLDGERILHQLRDEYYQQQQHLPEPVLPAGMDAREARECVRALKGLPLRQETYSFDGSPSAAHPYTVVEHNYEVRRLQPRAGTRHAAFLTFGSESVTYQYERNPSDPRVAHALNLEVGPFGNVLKSASVAYGRQVTDPALPSEVTRGQRRLSIAYGDADQTPVIDRLSPAPAYRLPVPYETRGYEITGLTPAAALFAPQELMNKIAGANSIPYEALADDVTAQQRPLSQSCTLFRDNALAPLPLGQWDTLRLGYETYRLAFTPGVTAAYYVGKVADADFTAAGYVHLGGDANWWIPSGVALYPTNPATHFYLSNGARDPLGLEAVVSLDAYDLLTERVSVTQAAWSEVRASNDYRVLGPVLMTDPNGNRSAVEIDALGLVVKTAVMGKAGAGEGDTLADPTSRLEYDLFNWMTNAQPNFVHVLAREQHGPANPRWQESYAYSNGSGAVAMVKAQVPPGKALHVGAGSVVAEVDANPRWVGNGRTILNNKGNAVKRYEPFFSPTFDYENEEALAKIGVTPVLYYDPVGRNVRVELPNRTLTRVVFDPWTEWTYDANDTVLDSRWYADRGSPDPLIEPEPLADPERRAAWLAAKHAGTPSVTHMDSLGRPVYAVSDYGGGLTAAVRSEMDLTGRLSSVFDQHQRQVASGFKGMAGTPIYSESAEKGARRTFVNALGGLVLTWDEFGREFRAEYDLLHRPLSTFASEAGQLEVLFNHFIYGDRHPQAIQLNLLGAAHQVFDPAGSLRVQALDFKGNPTSVERVLGRDYTNMPDWHAPAAQTGYAAVQTAAAPALETSEPFVAASSYDALNRPVQVTLPGGTVVTPAYDEANRLASLQALIEGQAAPVDFLRGQTYDARGQRLLVHYGNDVLTQYFHDPQTFRLTSLVTARAADTPNTNNLQDLHYTYDPVGNVTQYRDDAQTTNFFSNAVVQAAGLYEYDALYRLIRATGRELAAGTSSILDDADLGPINQLPHVNDLNAVRNYTEYYQYDLLGNILQLQHVAPVGNGNWTRHYHYTYQDSATDRTNRLASTSLPGDPDPGPYTKTYDHDHYGNLTHLRTPTRGELAWNVIDQLQRIDLGGGGTGHYVYDSGGQRVRKVIERLGGTRVERIYLGSFEIYRERQGANAPYLERHTLHISDAAGRIAQVDLKVRDDNNSDPANPLNTPLFRYQYGNNLGSAVMETNAVGSVISYEDYHPFGTTAYRSGKPGVDLSLKRYRFSGKERDDESGLYYFGARYYAQWLGRWTSADPAGLIDGLNLFVYCRNNPFSGRDRQGTQTAPLNPAGGVSWEIPQAVFRDKTGKLPDAQAIANFEAWLAKAHPDRPYTPGSATIDWSTMSGKRGPTFNAEWLDKGAQPLLPRKGEFGYVAPMRSQPKAEYVDPTDKSTRLTENEHGTPRAQTVVVESDYGKSEYQGDATVRSPRGVSLDKTAQDNASSAAIKQRVAAGGSVNVTEDIDMSSNANFQRANNAAKAAGDPNIRNPGSINRGTLEQIGGRFERGQGKGLPQGSGNWTSKVGAFASEAGTSVARAVIPGFAEVEVAAVFAHPFVVLTLGVQTGVLPEVAAAISAAPTATAFAVTLPALGGALAGNLVESAVSNAGGSKELSIGAAVLAAAGVGAIIGTFIPIPGVGTAAGAAIGAVIGVIGYGISKLF